MFSYAAQLLIIVIRATLQIRRFEQRFWPID